MKKAEVGSLRWDVDDESTVVETLSLDLLGSVSSSSAGRLWMTSPWKCLRPGWMRP